MSAPSRFLRREEVQQLTSLGRSSLFAMVASGAFPKPVRLSARRVGWVPEEVSAWMARRVLARDAMNSKALVQQR